MKMGILLCMIAVQLLANPIFVRHAEFQVSTDAVLTLDPMDGLSVKNLGTVTGMRVWYGPYGGGTFEIVSEPVAEELPSSWHVSGGSFTADVTAFCLNCGIHAGGRAVAAFALLNSNPFPVLAAFDITYSVNQYAESGYAQGIIHVFGAGATYFLHSLPSSTNATLNDIHDSFTVPVAALSNAVVTIDVQSKGSATIPEPGTFVLVFAGIAGGLKGVRVVAKFSLAEKRQRTL